MQSIFKTIFLGLVFLFSTLTHAQSEQKLAKQARVMIGKTDANSKKINTLKSWDAVKYCAKKAGIITESQSKSLKSSAIVNAKGFKVKSHTKIPSGYIIGFFNKGKLIHTMISTGNGKAVGVNNKTAIGIGTNKKWEEISLQQLKFTVGKGEFKFGEKSIKTITMVEKPASKILDLNYYKKNVPVKVNTQNNGIVERTDREQELIDVKANKLDDLKTANWSKKGLYPDHEYDINKAQFPEFKNWKQYAAKANSMLSTMKNASGKYVFTNPNYNIKRYGDIFIFDKKDKIYLRVDPKNKPMTMKKLSNISEFKKIYEDEINWDTFEGLKDKIKNAKAEFEQHKKGFKFRKWYDYAYHAQDLIDNIMVKQNGNNSILTKRVKGDLLYFNKRTGVFIAANRNNEVLTMLKPSIGIAHYNAFVATTPKGEYDIVVLPNEYDSTSSVLDPTPIVKWSQTKGSTAEKEYNKNKNSFPDIINWKDYAAKAKKIAETKKSATGKYTFKNTKLKVKRFGNVFLYDPVTQIFLELDQERLPVTMEKINTLKEFNERFKEEVKWDKYEGKKDQILNAKAQFAINKKYFKFRLWDEYAFYAQTLLENVTEKTKNNPKLHAQRNWKGHVIFYDETKNVLVAGNSDNQVFNMTKLDGDGLQTYHIYASQQDPVNPARANPEALAEWYRLSANYAKIDVADGIYTKPGNKIESIYDVPVIDNSIYDAPDSSLNNDDNSVTEDDDAMDIQENPAMYSSIMPKKKTTDWAKKGALPGVRVVSLEYRKHKKEFNNITLSEYVAIAHYFKTNTPKDSETKRLVNGNIVIYDDYSNLLGVYNPEGLPVTLTKPVNRRAAFDKME